MVTVNLEQRARELLAAEYERVGWTSDAFSMRNRLDDTAQDETAIRAIVAALRQQPAPVVDDASMVEWKPRNRTEAAALAKIALAHLGVVDAYIDNAIARMDTTGVLRGNADLVPAEHTYLTTRPENNHDHY